MGCLRYCLDAATIATTCEALAPGVGCGLSAPRVSEWEQENAEVCHDRGKEDAVEAVKDTAVTRKEVARVCTHNGVGV